MRKFLALLSVLAWSSSSGSAQSLVPGRETSRFFLQEGRLISEGQDVGHAVQATVQVTSAREDDVTITYRGRRLVVEANVRLDESHLQVGIARNSALTDTTFPTEMLRGAWAPVLRMSDARVVVALPPGSPEAHGSLARVTRNVRDGDAGRPRTGPWDGGSQAPRDDEAFHCTDFALSPTATSAPSFHPPNSAARHRLRSEGDFDVFTVTIQGFVFTGFRARTLPCVHDEISLGAFGIGVGSGDGAAHHRVVVMNPRTPLFATPTSTQAFATLLTRAYGIEIEVGVPSRFLVQVQDARATFQLRFFLHTPNDALRDAPPGHEGFGLTRTPMDDWPTR